MSSDRAFRMMIACNQIMIHAQDEQSLIDGICEVLVTQGGYRLAWWGIAEHAPLKMVRPAVVRGEAGDYLEKAHITWDDSEYGRGPTGTAIRTGKPVVVRSIVDDNTYGPWREQALKRGFRSSIALPIKDHPVRSNHPTAERIVGALNIYSSAPNAFNDEETELLIELANEIAFGISIVRTRTESQIAQEKFYKAFRYSPDVIIITSLDTGKIIEVSESMFRMTGYTSQEAVGKTSIELGLWVAPEHRQRLVDMMREGGLVEETEINFRRKDGELRQALITGDIIQLEGEEYLLAILRDITERKRAGELLHQQVEQLASLLSASQTLNATLDLPVVLQSIVESANSLLQLDTAAIYMVNHDNLWLGATTPALPEGFPESLRVARLRDHPHITQSIDTRQPLVVPDVNEAVMSEAEQVAVDARGIRTILFIPLRAVDSTVGVLMLGSVDKPVSISTSEIDLARTFGNMAAIAIQNARLVAETRQRFVELDALNRVSTALRSVQTLDDTLQTLLKETLSALNVEHGSILLYDAVSNELRHHAGAGWLNEMKDRVVQPGEGIAGRVFLSGETYVSSDFSGDPSVQSSRRPSLPGGWGGVCVPIRSSNSIIGAMLVSYDSTRIFSGEELNLLATLAEIGGIAIHRHRLFEQTELRLRLMQALYRIDITITASLDLRITLNVLLDQLTHQMGVHAASVLLYNPVTNNLEYAAGHGFRTKAIEKTTMKPGAGLAGRAMLERRITYAAHLQDPGENFTRGGLVRDEGFETYYGVPLVAKGQVLGVLEIFHRARLVLDKDWLDFLEALSAQAAIAIDDATLFESLQRTNFELARAYETTLEGWSHALDLRDKETEGHTQRVTEMTVHLATAMGMTGNELVHIRRGALLHDIGKMGIPDGILFKPGPLSEDEWAVMRQHPVYAYELLTPIQYLRPALDIPYCHHERWDGSGYPRGLRGEQIPLAARIFAVIDCWDALRSDRPYRPAWSEGEARSYLQEQSGKQYDPMVVQAFFNLF